MISSTQNQRVKQVRLLQSQARARRKDGLIVLEGRRLVDDALQQGHSPVHVFVTDFDLVPDSISDAIQVTPEVMRYMSDTQQPQGILAVFPMPEAILPPAVQRVLILDAISDPGNLGTMLRAAAASGTQAALLAPDCVDPYNPKTLRAGMGAHLRMPLVRMAWDEIEIYCAPYAVYLADSDGDIRYDRVDWTADWAVIIGSEAHGAGEAARALAQHRIHIPMAASSESINAAMATAVILFEAQRQRLTR